MDNADNNLMIKITCPCGSTFDTYKKIENRKKYCSKSCFYKYRPPAKRVKYTKHKENAGWFKKGEVESNRSRANVPTVCGVYKITNPLGEIYIGSSRTVYRRWLRHREARKKVPIHLSIKKYGWKAHIFEIICELPLDISEVDLINQEQVYIDAYTDCGFKMLNVKKAGHYLKKKKV